MPILISPLEELVQAHVHLTKSTKGPSNIKITKINESYHIGPANDMETFDITWRNLEKKTGYLLENLKTSTNGFILELFPLLQNKPLAPKTQLNDTRKIEIYIHRQQNSLPLKADYQEISHTLYLQRWLEFYH